MSVCVVGSLNLDVICRVAELPRPGETVAALGVERWPGGKGANQAVASARMGAHTTLIGAVGRDEAAAVMLTAVRSAGVVTQVVELAGHPTGQGFVRVAADGQNSIVIAAGANDAFSADSLSAPAIDEAHILLAQLETPVAATEAIFVAAGARGAGRILNAAPAIEDGRKLFPLTDILILNEVELARYAGLEAFPDHSDGIVAAARGLLAAPYQTIIVTLGAAGAMAINDERAYAVGGRPAAVVDTTGAGDCFCGVLAARLDEGEDLDTAMLWANAAASLSTERPGAAPSMPTKAQVEAELAR